MSDSASLDPARRPLASAFNLRDFGGHMTTDGRQVKRGMLYRSGTMALLSEADANQLRALGIKAICDFRRSNERKAEPTAWHGADVDYYCRDYRESSGLLGDMLRRDGATAQDMRDAMIALYRVIPADHADSYRAMFDRLLDGRLPLLINCSAGKDRTGVGAALILATLNVPREAILADYLLTNLHADWNWLLGQRDTLMARMHLSKAEALTPVLRAETIYMETLFTTLDERHGGVDGYLDALGMNAAKRDTLRGILLD
ncbi:tyrosine-protein phosphatase [Sphingobium rhizovicinum]|uniref:Tyrosine-protein phosphatase n=1 Tax=Sphingobium rhizovicinum TaxID=432308 RepID=A0ABV7NHD0_9SPHN